MSYGVSVLLNYFVVLIEAVAFLVFSSTFFQHKINMCKLILSTVALTSLSMICLTISDFRVECGF